MPLDPGAVVGGLWAGVGKAPVGVGVNALVVALPPRFARAASARESRTRSAAATGLTNRPTYRARAIRVIPVAVALTSPRRTSESRA